MDKESSKSSVPLAEALEMLRQELEQAVEQSKDQPIRFEMAKVELELKVIISSKTKGDAGVKLYFVKAGAAIEDSDETVHTVKLTLNPVNASTGKRTIVSGPIKKKPS